MLYRFVSGVGDKTNTYNMNFKIHKLTIKLGIHLIGCTGQVKTNIYYLQVFTHTAEETV